MATPNGRSNVGVAARVLVVGCFARLRQVAAVFVVIVVKSEM
jgi:hypothetical protein